MRLRKNINLSKNGSYLVEAAIIVPIFIIATLLLITVIPVIGKFENITYEATEELRSESVKSYFRQSNISFPSVLKKRVKKENPDISNFKVDSYWYLYSDAGIDDLISVKFTAKFSKSNPLNLYNNIEFEGKIVARAFTGTEAEIEPKSYEEFASNEDESAVYIFPESGSKHHKKSCRYLQSNCLRANLTSYIKKKYKACKLCDAKNAEFVYVFSSGSVYHLASCKSVDKYFILTDRESAENKHYTACSACN